MLGPPALVAHLRALLIAGLPLPEGQILRPEQQREPYLAGPRDAAGRPAVGEGPRGLSAYLARHPDGFVQIEDPVPSGNNGAQDVYWTAVGAVATTREQAHTLAHAVRIILTGTRDEPGFFRTQSSPSTASLAPDAVLVRVVYTRTLILGVVPT
ncbi:hypothetical protein [Deinococcus soli (ex Cha et al. 2016)]|uniref:hypothetical protein n=1 Tax=Deinococcus soli (ex Cha et al. 2016) TaxID=1309411 RepID=UPI00166662F6|nr:hypothetical protein [Deinococcus soli (ex Cha et al. 2016)]GGB69496.1 hypothetical protein GCM10008019_27100 [Deinococcus soli (ex Cha et al. 2016)]